MKYTEEQKLCSIYEEELSRMAGSIDVSITSLSLNAIEARITNESEIPAYISSLKVTFLDCVASGCTNIYTRSFDIDVAIPSLSARDFSRTELNNTFNRTVTKLSPRGQLRYSIDEVHFRPSTTAASGCLNYRVGQGRNLF